MFYKVHPHLYERWGRKGAIKTHGETNAKVWMMGFRDRRWEELGLKPFWVDGYKQNL
jgi:hypothetical protein